MAKNGNEPRQMGRGTLALEKARLSEEAKLKAKELELKHKQLELADRDKERDDHRALVRSVLTWSTSIAVLALLAGALYWQRAIVFKGFGIEATTGGSEEIAPEEIVPEPSEETQVIPVTIAPEPVPVMVQTPTRQEEPVIIVPAETLDQLIDILSDPAEAQAQGPEAAPEPVTIPDL